MATNQRMQAYNPAGKYDLLQEKIHHNQTKTDIDVRINRPGHKTVSCVFKNLHKCLLDTQGEMLNRFLDA